MELSLFWTLLSYFAIDEFDSAAHSYVVRAVKNCMFDEDGGHIYSTG